MKNTENTESYNEIPKQKQTSEFPLHLDIETTNVCNLLSLMCPRTVQLANESFGELGYLSKMNIKIL